MSYVMGLWDKIEGNFFWFILATIGLFVGRKLRPWIERLWKWFIGLFQKKEVVETSTSPSTPKISKLDTVGVSFLALAIILLALWNHKLEQDIHTNNIEIVRYVLPRELTKAQIDTFGKYLVSHTQPHEVRIKFIQGDAESQQFAESFASAFMAGNWLPQIMPVNPTAVTCRASSQGSTPPFICSSDLEPMLNSLNSLGGARILQSGPNPPQPTTLEQKVHPPKMLYETVSDALDAAGIKGIGYSYGGNDDPLETITVYVGHRKRDKFAVLPPNFNERMPKNPDVTDDAF